MTSYQSNKKQPPFNDFSIEINSLQIAVRAWGDAKGKPILALHGWLDNFSSFDLLIPKLLEKRSDLYIIAIDFPGHGHSQHYKDSDSGFFFLNFITLIKDVIKAFHWDKVSILGHSMGGAVGIMFAAIIPELITHIICIDTLGFFSEPASKVLVNFRKHIENRENFLDTKKPPLYLNPNVIIRARAIKNKISRENAERIIMRNLLETPKGHTWRTDKYLTLEPPVFFTEEQMLFFMKAIKQPCLLLMAQENSFPAYYETIKNRATYVENLEAVWDVPGGHHCHLEKPEIVSDTILKWLKKYLE